VQAVCGISCVLRFGVGDSARGNVRGKRQVEGAVQVQGCTWQFDVAFDQLGQQQADQDYAMSPFRKRLKKESCASLAQFKIS
jgi:hypothetical protein